MTEALQFWLASTVIGAAAFPLTFAFFTRLADRGYAFTRVVGLLVLGYTLWIGATIRLFPNTRGTVLLLVFVLALASLAALARRRDEIVAYLREGWRYMLLVEALFAAVFITAALLRSFVPVIEGGEKPFELAFLNAAIRNETFPPEDPWLAGSPISYYYFGYVMMAALTNLAGLAGNVTFYMSISLLAAMAATAMFGVVYNLIAAARPAELIGSMRPLGPRLWPRAVAFGLVGVGMLLLLTNLEGLFELLARHGVGSAGFYDSLGIYGLSGPYDCDLDPGDCEAWYPTRDMWWWWATRIGSPWDVQEFPFFTFHFGDLHPHVLGLPFVITAVAIALQLFRSEERLDFTWPLVHPVRFLFAAAFIGGLGFLNLWDLPTFLMLVAVAALGANWLNRRKLDGMTLLDTAGFIVPLAIMAVVMYIPFYITFDTPTSGLAPVEAATRPAFAPLNSAVTRPLHLLLFWGPILWLALPFALSRLAARGDAPVDRQQAAIGVLPWLAPLVVWLAWVLVIRGVGGTWDEIETRAGNWLTLLMLATALAAAAFAFARELRRAHEHEGARRSYAFALLALGGGLMLILGPELFFVDDINDFRPNTVFKLWFQAWMLLSIAGAFGLYHLTRDWRLRPIVPARLAWAGATAVIVGVALLYPLMVVLDRTGDFGQAQYVDGYIGTLYVHPGEYEAIRWLNDNVEGEPVLVEAVERSYGRGGRISGSTGIPAVLGWPGHERLWRGERAPVQQREAAVRELYETEDAAAAQEILLEYGVEYVYVGWLERETYDPEGLAPARFDKFGEFMDVVFRNEETTIYRMPEAVAQLTQAEP